MSRLNDLVNRIERLAKKFEMSIEDVVSILEGKHPTYKVVTGVEVTVKGGGGGVGTPVENPTDGMNPPTVAAATSNSTEQAGTMTSTASAPSAVIPSTSEAENPIGSGDAAASAGVGTQQAAGSTVAAGANNED